MNRDGQPALISFPPVQDAVRKLSEWGVTMLTDVLPHEPGAGSAAAERFPWTAAWHALLDRPRLSTPG